MAGGLHQAELLALPAVAVVVLQVGEPAALPVFELVGWPAVELPHLTRIGGQCWSSCSTRPNLSPGRWSS